MNWDRTIALPRGPKFIVTLLLRSNCVYANCNVLSFMFILRFVCFPKFENFLIDTQTQ